MKFSCIPCTTFDVQLLMGFSAGRTLQTKHNTAIIRVPSGLILGQQNDNAHATRKPSEITGYVPQKLNI